MRFAQVQGADGTDDAADNEGHENGFDHNVEPESVGSGRMKYATA